MEQSRIAESQARNNSPCESSSVLISCVSCFVSVAVGMSLSSCGGRACADDPPAPVVVEETAEPIKARPPKSTTPADNGAGASRSRPKAERTRPTRRAERHAENAGLDDLDKATQLKVTAENLPDLNDVVDKLDSAIGEGPRQGQPGVCRPAADLDAAAAGDGALGGRARSSAGGPAARSALDAGAAVCAQRFAARALARRQDCGKRTS